MAAVQQGMKSLGFRGTKPNPYRERSTVNLHTQLAKYMGTGEPQELRDTMTLFDTCGPTQTPDDIDIDALREKYAHEREQAIAPRRRDAVPGTQGRLRGVRRDRSAYTRHPAHSDQRGRRGGGSRRWHRRPAGGGIPQEGGRRRRTRHRDGWRLRWCLVLEPIPRHSVRQRRVLLHTAARRARLRSIEEVRRRRGDLRALPQHRQALRAVRRCDLLHPGSHGAAGTRTSSAGGWPPTVATTSVPASWS